MGSPAQDPVFDLLGPGHDGFKQQRSILLRLKLLAVVPDLFLIGLEPQMKNLFGSIEVFYRFFGQGGLDLVEQRFQVIVKDRILEDLHHVPAEVKGHQFHQVERDGYVMLHGVQQGPEVLAVHPLGVDGEPGHLEGLQISVNRPGIGLHFGSQPILRRRPRS
jgi:hypothetical protein